MLSATWLAGFFTRTNIECAQCGEVVVPLTHANIAFYTEQIAMLGVSEYLAFGLACAICTTEG